MSPSTLRVAEEDLKSVRNENKFTTSRVTRLQVSQ